MFYFSHQFNTDSDLDLIFDLQRPSIIFRAPMDFEVDIVVILVYTPEEFEKISKEENKVGFWKSSFSQMQKII